MNLKKISCFTFSLLVGVAVFIHPSVVEAVTMSPIRIELAADPGQSTTGVIKVYNDDNNTRTFYLSVAKFESKDETGEPKFVPAATDELVAWTKLPESITVPPQESKEVNFQVNVPKDVDPGGYFAAVFASVVPPAPKGAGSVALQSDVGTLLLFRVNGSFPEGETVLEFNTKNKKHFFNSLPVEFYFRFQNSGKDRVQPLGDITIKNIFGRITKVVNSNPGAGNVLPESIRRFEVAWSSSGDSIVENFSGQVVYPEFKNFSDAVKYQSKNFALGRYSADLSLTVNNDASRSYEKSIAFWVIPWQLMLVILVIIVVFFIPLLTLIFFLLRYFIRKRKQGK